MQREAIQRALGPFGYQAVLDHTLRRHFHRVICYTEAVGLHMRLPLFVAAVLFGQVKDVAGPRVYCLVYLDRRISNTGVALTVGFVKRSRILGTLGKQ